MLNNKQRKVVYDIAGNTIVSASPGSGKTKTLVARAQHKLQSIPRHKALALITYTNAAADEISERLQDEGTRIFTGTIHRFCLEYILRPYGWLYGWHKPRVVTYEELMEFIEANKDIDLGESPLDQLNKIKKNLAGELDLSVPWENTTSLKYVAELFYAYLQEKKAIDFNEILYRSYKIISENDFALTSLSSKFHEISVDEFQDTNAYQYEILKSIHKKGTCTFFLVGDEKQRIYRFAGAIENAFNKAIVDFSATIETLEITYRSTSNIIDAYSALFPGHPKLTNDSKYKNADVKLVFRETNKNNHNTTIEEIIKHCIDKLHVEVDQIAILSTRWQDALDVSRGLRSKYRTVGLGAIPHKNLNNSTFNLVKTISKFLHQPSTKSLRIVKRGVELHLLECNLSLTQVEINLATNNLITKFNHLDKSVSLIQGLIHLKSIFDMTFHYSHATFEEIDDMLNEGEAAQWTLNKYLETLSGLSGIMVNTIHQVKGLEYDVVILNNVNENKIPYQHFLGRDGNNFLYAPLTEENINDGRTLLYVGISRAKALLIVTYNWKPSMFIKTIKPT